MRASPKVVNDELRATLWQTAGVAVRARVGDLEDLVRRMFVSPLDAAQLASHAIPIAHSIAGSAGVFGVPRAARSANEIERALRAWRPGEPLPASIRYELDVVREAIDASLEVAT